jgi:hypothetical protein
MGKGKLKATAVGVAAAVFAVFTPAVVLAQGNDNPGNKVTICHATGSQSNPYVQNSPNANGVISGHVDHQHTEDIIPPFTYNDKGSDKNFPGQNWNASGQATLNNGCVVPGGRGAGDVLGSSTTGGQGAGAQVNAPAGAVGAGFGGGATALSRGAMLGLGTSLLSIGTGLALLNRRKV